MTGSATGQLGLRTPPKVKPDLFFIIYMCCVYLVELQRERDRNGECPLTGSLFRWGWAELKLGARTSIQVCCLLFRTIIAAFQGAPFGGRWDPGVIPRHSDMGHGVLTATVNTRPNT